jgi:acetoin utilization deacetylase AcuC-like enzyme
VYRSDYQTYDFGPVHPLRPERMRSSLDLIESLDLRPPTEEYLRVPAATREELQFVHDAAYIDAVQRLDDQNGPRSNEASRWGLGSGDSPAFDGMHSASALISGGSLNALRAILEGKIQHAFNPAGGLHHAMRNRASGFCIYNDPAIAIAAALREHDVRVLYLDFDAHHGDGVQAAFYTDPRVLTFSIHETGRHLFPGTGFVDEVGEGPGRGYSFNLPVEPFTEDASWIDCLKLLLEPMAEWFQPDAIVSQHGCDSHAWDPITHLRISTRAFATQASMVHQLAHRFAGGRWLATGGGGYDWVRVVPRSWSIVWAEMSGRALPAHMPPPWSARWAADAERHGFWPIPDSLLDETDAWQATARRAEIAQINRSQADALRSLVP